MRNYSDIATKYAHDVIAGTIPACRWVRLACAKYLDDREKAADSEYPYCFDEAKATRVCKFIEAMPHVVNDFKNRASKLEKLVLLPWQVFIFANLFGFVFKESGLRRYREAYITIPKKNGKSTIMAGLALYMLIADKEMSANVKLGARGIKHVTETLFEPAKKMIQSSPALKSKMGIQVNAASIVVPGTGSKLECVIGDPGDGPSISCGIMDESHELSTAALYDKFKTGTIARAQPLIISITTAGFDLSVPCYNIQIQAQQVLEGTFQDDQLFSLIYTLDVGDDWTTEEALIKANPNYGVSINAESIRHEQLIAIQDSSKQNTFKTKNLNIWCNASSEWMNMENWAKCGESSLKPEDFKDCECFVGMDLASKIDAAAVVKIFRKVIDGKVHYYAFPKFYLPSDRTNDPTCQHYQKWVHDGFLTATEGSEIDYETIKRDLLADAEIYNIKVLGYDPFNATDFTQSFNLKTGIERVEVPQRVQYLSEPMKHLEAMTISGRYHHNGNPVMTWMMSNVVAHPDANDNLFPRKQRNENKIDGVSATLCALHRALATPIETKSKFFRMQFIT